MHTAADTFTRTVEAAGERLTAPRRAVAELIAAKRGHFTAAELVADAGQRRPGLGRATVFRTLELFTQLGLVERLDLPTGGHAYVACQTAHHHHLVCSSCGRAVDVEDHGLAAALEEVARRTGYRVDSHRLELFGRCPACQRAGGTA
ncbi:MAG TPA: Fur family transcriptional regulator [Candidatus Limnocylindrales bacterium]